MQSGLAAVSVIETAYFTQQTGGLTRGMTLRPIQAAKPISCGLPLVNRSAHRLDPRPVHCVQYATVHFYADGPSDPGWLPTRALVQGQFSRVILGSARQPWTAPGRSLS